MLASLGPSSMSGMYSLKVYYTQASLITEIPSLNYPSLIEDFEISYVRTNIDDRNVDELPRLPTLERRVPPVEFIHDADQSSEDDESMSEDTETESSSEQDSEEHADILNIRVVGHDKLADLALQAASLAQAESPTLPCVVEEAPWEDDEDPNKKWYFHGKAYSKIVSGKEQYYCQLCEDAGNVHCCLKRREMERHLRRLDHLPPELFCKSAQAVCPCSKNRAFTRIDGRKRHIKISIEHARRAAQARRDVEEVERLNRHMRLLETSRGR